MNSWVNAISGRVQRDAAQQGRRSRPHCCCKDGWTRGRVRRRPDVYVLVDKGVAHGDGIGASDGIIPCAPLALVRCHYRPAVGPQAVDEFSTERFHVRPDAFGAELLQIAPPFSKA